MKPALKLSLLTAALTFCPAAAFSAGFGSELSLENAASIEVPEAQLGQDDRGSAAVADYARYFATLSHYSDMAFRSEPGSEAYMEAYLAGSYLKTRLDESALALQNSEKSIGARLDLDFARPDAAAMAEVAAFFGWDNVMKDETLSPPVTIKAGFATIKFVKGNTPFLVQGDSFLKQGEVILTFDDGPDTHGLTASVLEANAGRAPSIFFVLGHKLGASGRAVIRDEADRGHEVSLHGYWHATETGKPFTRYSTEQVLADLGKTADLIKSATGKDPSFFRPPYGVIAPQALNAAIDRLGVTPMGWTIDTLDWSTKNPDELFAKTTELIKRRGKGIILMHDIHPQSVQVNARLIEWLARNGYKIVDPDKASRAFRGL